MRKTEGCGGGGGGGGCGGGGGGYPKSNVDRIPGTTVLVACDDRVLLWWLCKNLTLMTATLAALL